MKKLMFALALACFAYTATQAKDDPKKIEVKVTRHAVEKTRGANANIKVDEPTKDVELTRPAGYVNKAGAGSVQVQRKANSKTRGANPNIVQDAPSVDVEMEKPVK